MGIGNSRGSNRAASQRRRGPGSNVRPSRHKPRRSRASDPMTTAIVPTAIPPPMRRMRHHPHPSRPPMILPPISIPLPMQPRMSPASAFPPLYNPYSPYSVYQPAMGPYPSMIPRSIPVATAAPQAGVAASVPPIVVPLEPSLAAPQIFYPPASGWTGAGQVLPNYNIPASMPVQTAVLPRISRNLYTDWTGGGVISPGFLGPPL